VPGDLLILCYHAVSEDWPADLSLRPDAFERQIRNLLRRGYHGLTLSESQSPGRRRKSLVVTFDDGYLSTLTMAAPIMARLGIPGTVFVPSGFIGREEPMSWPGIDRWLDTPHRSELVPLSWEQTGQLADAGWEVGSHTISHPKLTQLADPDLAGELRDSKAAIEAELGRPCPTIAYPYGDVDQRVAAAAAAAGYRCGVGLPARWTTDDDPMQLPRVGIYNGQDGAKLALKTSALTRRARARLGR
jgi:peptidoglycan/xylan/chitin deacetylase (PgdA/CDA1 family)